jgi:hypothetical protein
LIDRVFYLEDIYDERIGLTDIKIILRSFLGENESLLFAYTGWKLMDEELHFVLFESVFESNQCVFENRVNSGSMKMRWFEADSDERLNWALSQDYLFQCVVHSKKGNLMDYSYALHVQENIDSYSLVIYAKNIELFKDEVLPKILKSYSGILTWGSEW